MRRSTLVFLLILFVLAGNLWAQTVDTSIPTHTVEIGSAAFQSPAYAYEVKQGDSLWKFKQAQWRELLALNPKLNDKSRIKEISKDLTVVKVFPGETIQVTPSLMHYVGGNTPQVDQGPQIPPPQKITPNPIQEVPTENRDVFLYNVLFPWLAVVGLLAIGLYLLAKKLFTWHPAEAGPPIVSGGIPASEPARVEARFVEMIESRHPGHRWIRVGPVEEGFLSGWGTVSYQGGATRRARFNREPAFRARFREEGGTREEELVFLQACGNDVSYLGTRYVGYTFEPGRHSAPVTATETPATSPAPEPVAPAAVAPPDPPPAAPPAPAAITPMPLREVENREAPPVIISLGQGSLSVPAGSRVRFENGQIIIEEMGAGVTRIMASPKKKKPRQIKSRSTGTAG